MVAGAFWGMRGKETGFSPLCLCEVSGSLQNKEEEVESEIIFEVDEDLEEIIGEEMVIVFTPDDNIKSFIVSDEDAKVH